MSLHDDPLTAFVRVVDGANERNLSRLERAAQRLRPTPATDTPPLRAVEVGDLRTATAEPPSFVVEPIIPRGEVTLFGGHGGSGKSALALVIAAHVAAGVPWAGLSVAQGRVLFVTLEDPAGRVVWRLRAICEAYGLPMHAVARGLVIFDGADDAEDCALARESTASGRALLESTAAMDQIRVAADGAALVVIDNASDAFDGNENDRRQVRAFVRRLASIARQHGAGLLLLAHVDKQAARFGSQGNSYSGSTAWHNSARSRLALVDADGTLELRHEKANFSAKADAVALRFDGAVPLPTAAGAASGADDLLLRHCLHAAILRGDVVSTARTGPSSTFVHARTLAGFPPALKAPARFWAALGRLEASGAIEREGYVNAGWKRRQKWAIPAGSEPAGSPPITPRGTGGVEPAIPPIPPIAEPAGTGGPAGMTDPNRGDAP